MDSHPIAPPDAAVTAAAPPPSSPQIGRPGSVGSSPRSRNADPWDEHLPAVPAGGSKLRLMCSYGGHIVPRPQDKTLFYVGGDTRIVVADRHSSLAELTARLSKTLLAGRSFNLKYQLPNEDLDSLISISTDEDLENMIDEYDRTSSSNKLSRLRLFLFPTHPDSAASIASLLDSSTRSEDWFFNALNGIGIFSRSSSESQSANCLVSLDNDGAASVGGDSQAKTAKLGQDVHSIPDSPMLETTSSFGSTSSLQSMANLPSIRGAHVVEDHKAGIEEQFSQMSLAPSVEVPVLLSSPPPVPSTFVTVATVPVCPAPISGDYSGRFVSDDERSDQGMPGGYLKRQPQPQPQPLQSQQKPSAPAPAAASGSGSGLELPSPDSVSSDCSLTNAMPRSNSAAYQEQVMGQPKRVDPKINIFDPNPRLPPHLQQQVQDATGYVLTSQFDQQHQFLPYGTHYVQHHQPTGRSVQVPSYYPVYPSQPHNPQIDPPPYPMYILRASSGPGQAFGFSTPQSNPTESPAPVPSGPAMGTPSSGGAYAPGRGASPPPKPEMASPGGMYRARSPALVQMPPGQHQQQQYMGFPQLHHASQSWSAAAANYGYEFADPGRAPVYYSQAPLPQGQTAAPAAVHSEAASRIQADRIRPPSRTSQP